MIKDRSIQAIGGAGIAWLFVGWALINSDNSGGWIFFILGLAYLAGTIGPGKSVANENPKLLRWVIAGLTALVLLIAIVALIR